MIAKLRKKFIAVSMASVLAVLFIIMGSINVWNYFTVQADADALLEILMENGGSFPAFQRTEGGLEIRPMDGQGRENMRQGKKNGIPKMREEAADSSGSSAESGDSSLTDEERAERDQRVFDARMRRGMSQETPFESRYFSVLIGADDTAQVNTSMIAAVDEEEAETIAREVLASGKTKGFYEDYRFLSGAASESGTEEGTRLIFLDCTRTLTNFRNFLLASVAVALLGSLAVFLLLIIFSSRIIKPVAESYEKQKRFITDAGHEIKTPLTIISADCDILEMENGESEWLQDIKGQTSRLAELTNELIYLSKMEENQSILTFVRLDLSKLTLDMAESFRSRALVEEKKFRIDIGEGIFVTGDEAAVKKLVSILLDNAMKYSPEGGEVRIGLTRSGKMAKLTVYNESEPLDKESIGHLFDRFYRTDRSRNSETGGHGIGLSTAQAIANALKGQIKASSEDYKSLTMTVTLPLA